MRATRALIYKDNLEFNFKLIKNNFNHQTFICAVVKANAYGHGIEMVAPILDKLGAHRFAVACLSEARRLRAMAITKPIHLLSPCMPYEISEAIYLKLIPFISSFDEARLWQSMAKAINKEVTVHIKVNLSMNRIGCDISELIPLTNFVSEQSYLKLEGIASHFANGDDTTNPSLEDDLFNFTHLVTPLKQQQPHLIVHCANSAAIQRLAANNLFNMVRPGIALYGYSPSSYAQQHSLLNGNLKPVMELCSFITFIHQLKEDSAVSYGSLYVAKKGSYLATIPLGYADGYSNIFSNKEAAVAIKGKLYNIAGFVCMDQLIVDLKDNPDNIKLYDKAIFFGPNSPSLNAAQLTVGLAHFSPYMLLSGISQRVERVIVE
ncbi:MAG: alanine racemase [Spirochaetaceae bacterium]|nr:alanine racemase [Spirochaetaceae bacterium]